MSRCFPFPPSGYALGQHSQAALIESIKPERESDHGKNDSKREKVDKRKAKKYKILSKIDGQINGKLWPEGKLFEDESKAKIESSERSNLTEEHGEPLRLVVPSTSSDSTENSNSRKRPLSPAVCPPPATGKIIRIRLSKKPELSVVDSSAKEEQHCSTSGQEAEPFPVQNLQYHSVNARENASVATAVFQNCQSKTQAERRVSAFHQSVAEDLVKPVACQSTLDAATSKRHKAYLKYNILFQNWDPLPLQEQEPSDNDMDWLFNSKREPRQKLNLFTQELPCTASWPRAHYIQEIGLHALPYTVPF